MAKKSLSKLDSYALTVIALSALFVSIWQVNSQRKHDRFSVMPYLQWDSERNENGYTMLKVKNKGYGPAIFQQGYLQLADTTFNNWATALQYLDPSLDVVQSLTLGGALTLLPGEELLLVTAKVGNAPIQFTYTVEFENLYEDHYEDEYTHVGYPFRN